MLLHQQHCGNNMMDYQDHTNNTSGRSQTMGGLVPQPHNLRVYHYQNNYSDGPQPVNDESRMQFYDHNGGHYVNNHPSALVNNFVNQHEIVNNPMVNNPYSYGGHANTHKRKHDAMEEKEDIVEDDDQSPTITSTDDEYSRDVKRVKTSLTSILANLQVSEREHEPQTNSTCTQLMCYDQNIPNLTLNMDCQPRIPDFLRKKAIASLMSQSTGDYIVDPRADIKLQSSSNNSEEAEDHKNKRALVLYRDVIGRNEVLRRLGKNRDDPQSTGFSNQMTDE